MTLDRDQAEVERRRVDRLRLWHDALAGVDFVGKTVLDAGTGEGHCTRFLAQRRPARLVSVTCLPGEIAPARRRLGEWADAVDFQTGDLTCMPQIADGRFDIVVGDFLIAAVAGYRPFREVDCIKELARVLAPHGALVLTGWEAETTTSAAGPGDGGELMETQRLFLDLIRLRETLHLITNSASFREHPSWWIVDRLGDLNMRIERQCGIPDMHRDLSWLVRQTQKLLDDVDADDLKQALKTRLETLKFRLLNNRRLADGFSHGRLYAVVARKPAGSIVVA